MALLRVIGAIGTDRHGEPVGERSRSVSCPLSWAVLAVVIGLAPSTAARAESFLLNDGKEVSGEIIQGFSHMIMVKSDIGTVVPLALDNIQLVEIDLADGKQILGQLLSWENGVFLVGVHDRIMQVADGRILGVEDVPAVAQEEPPAVDDPSGIGGPLEPESVPRLEEHLRNVPM